MTRRMQTALRLLAALGAYGAPALFAQMALVQNAGAQVQQAASSLPPPPYASANQPARYGGMQGYDRYGGGAPHPVVAARAGAPVYVGPRLSWSGKTEGADTPQSNTGYAQPAPSAQAVSRGWVPLADAMSGQPAPARPMPARTMPSQAMPAQAALSQSAPSLRSIYDPAPAQAAPAMPGPPIQAAAANTGNSRLYSVHREYGMEPTAIPIPPQFFGATADLTEPETPEPARRTPTANGKTRNAVQPSDGQ